MTWTRVIDADEAALRLPAWAGTRMIGARGRFGLMLTTGDVLRITSVVAANISPDGLVLLDVLLDHAGVPDGVDTAWQSKHYLGAPVPGATFATVNMAQVVAVIEFVAAEIVEPDLAISAPAGTEGDVPSEVVMLGSDAVATLR